MSSISLLPSKIHGAGRQRAALLGALLALWVASGTGGAAGQASPPPPPRYYLMSVIAPGRAVETRSGSAPAGSTIGNAFGGFGCGPTVTRNGFLLTTDWRLLPLCPLPGGVESQVSSFAISGAIVAAGRSRSASGGEVPVVWTRQSDGTFRAAPLPLPAGSRQGIAHAIDNLGTRFSGEVEQGALRVPAFWPSATSLPQAFPLPGAGSGTRLRGTGADALVAGVHGDRFFLWYPNRPAPGNLAFPLGAPPSTPKGLRWSADPPLVAGITSVPAEGVRGFVWRGAPPVEKLGTLGGNLSEAADTNGTQTIGGSNDAQGVRRAVLWEGGKLYDLNQALLPTCRAGDPALCTPLVLHNANALGPNGFIAGQAMAGSDLQAVLLRPVGPFAWTLGACANSGGTSCQAGKSPLASGSSPFSSPLRKTATAGSGAATGTVTSQGARALAKTRTTGSLHAHAAFQTYLIVENLSLAKILSGTSPTVRVLLHFKVNAGVSTCLKANSLGGVTASLAVRPAAGPQTFASTQGTIALKGATPPAGSGIFSTRPNGGSFEVTLPVDLAPRSERLDSLELRIEGEALADAAALTTADCAGGDLTVQFCASDPSALTLENGRTLASLGVRYAVWPAVTPTPACGSGPL